VIARGKGFDSFGIYADAKKFLFEVNGVVVSLFKVRESYSEAHLYLKEHFVKEDPVPLDTAAIDPPRSQGGSIVPSHTRGGVKKRYFQGQHVAYRRAQCDRI
jgi:hypothetical protein